MKTPCLTVFYDGGCRLCGREIAHYRRLPSLVPIDWIDITREPEKLARFGLDVPRAMAEFHVLDDAGTMHKGADGFIRLWSVLPYYRHLSSLCRVLRIQGLMRRFYGRFARWHFRRRCADGACATL